VVGGRNGSSSALCVMEERADDGSEEGKRKQSDTIVQEGEANNFEYLHDDNCQ